MLTTIKILLIFSVILVTAVEFSQAASIHPNQQPAKIENKYPVWMIVLLVLFALGFFGLLIGGFITWKLKVWCFAHQRKSSSYTSMDAIPEKFVIPEAVPSKSARNENTDDNTNLKAMRLPVNRQKSPNLSSEKDEKVKQNLLSSEKIKKPEKENEKLTTGKENNEKRTTGKRSNDLVPLEDVLSSEKTKKPNTPSKKLYPDAYGKNASPYETMDIEEITGKNDVKVEKPVRKYPDAYGKRTSPYQINTLEESGKK